MVEEVILRFEIFAKYVNGVKRADTADVPVEELIVVAEEPKEDVAALGSKRYRWSGQGVGSRDLCSKFHRGSFL